MRNQQPQQQTIFQYIAFGPTAGEANKMIVEYGMPQAKSRVQLAESLAALAQVHDSFIDELAEIHPDRELILGNMDSQDKRQISHPVNFSGEHLNCAGCNGACGSANYHSANGQDAGGKNVAQMMAQNNMIAAALALVVVGFVAIVALKK